LQLPLDDLFEGEKDSLQALEAVGIQGPVCACTAMVVLAFPDARVQCRERERNVLECIPPWGSTAEGPSRNIDTQMPIAGRDLLRASVAIATTAATGGAVVSFSFLGNGSARSASGDEVDHQQYNADQE
jgi:hypothetical protein